MSEKTAGASGNYLVSSIFIFLVAAIELLKKNRVNPGLFLRLIPTFPVTPICAVHEVVGPKTNTK